MYSVLDASMIRTSVFPLACTVSSWPGEDADVEQIRAWIEAVWAEDPRAEAIGHASPVLAGTVREVIDGASTPSRTRRVGRSLARYLLRMTFRATPFGLFAGPTTARTGQEAHVHWGSVDRAVAYADAAWLHDIITALEADPSVLRYLTVTADPTHVVRGSHILIATQPGEDGPTDTSLRRTRAAETTLQMARSPIPVHVLVAKLGMEYPDAPKAAVEKMVRELVKHRVLLTELRPPMTRPDALGHLIDRLDETGADVPMAARLRTVHRLLDRHDRAHPDEQPELRTKATAAMTALTHVTERTLVVNVRPDCDITLPHAVAREAEEALRVMTRITPYPHGSPVWTDYRNRFLERYSMGAVVPVLELTDPDTGLGFPVGYRGTVLSRPVLATTPRDEHLLALVQDATLTGRREIVLTEQDIDALSLGEPNAVPAHAEFCFTVLAHSTQALTAGRFHLSTVGLSLSAGTLTGRFLPMLDLTDQIRMTAEYAGLPTLTDGAVRVQLSSPPLRRQTLNVSRTPLVTADALAIGEHNADATFDLEDLGVVADSGRLYLVSLSTGQCLEPSMMNAVELSTATHPLARFLFEVHRSHAAVPLPFFWGAAGRLPFLPEVRYGRTILSAACWRLRARDLPNPGRWTQDFADWRVRYGVSRTVRAGSGDQQLRLDLDLPAHRDLLRAELDRHRTLDLHEAPEESAYGWIGRAHEVSMAFAADQPPVSAPARRAVARRDAGRLPGATERAYLKVYGGEARAAEVLTAHLPRLLRELSTAPDEAWFIRYSDPDAHLRLRLRLPSPEAFGAVAGTVADWAGELREEGLIQRVQWDTEQPETGRYGGGAALAAAERYFAADSIAALAQMELAVSAELRPAVTAASFVDIATGFLGSPAAAHDWLTRHLMRNDGASAPRPVQAFVLRLTERDDAGPVLADLTGGEAVLHAWQRRREALVDYRRTLESDDGADPSGVLPSLLHMHHNRVAGIAPDAEALCRRMARATALSWSIRPEGAAR